MRKSRRKFKKEHLGNKYFLMIVFLIVLPIVSIIPGYFGSKYFIIPHLFSDNEGFKEVVGQEEPTISEQEQPSEGSQPKEEIYINTLELTGLDFYSIQVGSFLTKANAQELVRQLEEVNFGAYIHESDGFKVFTLSLLDRNQIDMLMPEILEIYDEAFVVTTSIPNRSIKYSQEETQYCELLQSQNNKINKVFKDLSELVYHYKRKTLSYDELNKLLLQTKNDLNQIKQDMLQGKPSSRMQSIHDQYVSLINNLVYNMDNYSSIRPEEGIIPIQNLLTSGTFTYLKISAFSEI